MERALFSFQVGLQGTDGVGGPRLLPQVTLPEKLPAGNLGRIWQLVLGTGSPSAERGPGPAGWDGQGCVHAGFSIPMGTLLSALLEFPDALWGGSLWARGADAG